MFSYNKDISSHELKKLQLKIRKVIGAELKIIRKVHGISGMELGNLINKSQQQISRYENGSTVIPLDILILLLYLFETPPDVFFERIFGHIKSDTNAQRLLNRKSKLCSIYKCKEYWKSLL